MLFLPFFIRRSFFSTGIRNIFRSTSWAVFAATGTLLCVPTAPCAALDAVTLPQGGEIQGGSAEITYTDKRLDINQHSDRLVIDWDSFNIGKNATTEFHQPGSSSLAVNRVLSSGVDPTQILGTLKANGKVMVLDPNGVFFGQDSVIDVGSLIASTGNIDISAVMRGDTILEITGAHQGSIVNYGTISVAEAGLAAFVAPTVQNAGVIEAKLGRIELAGASSATVDLYGDGLIELAADGAISGIYAGNSGRLEAEGGTIYLSARAAQGIVNSLVNADGIINASSATVEGGKIILEADHVQVSGTLDASGATGGGEILMGGDVQGTGDVRTSQTTIVNADAVIRANATEVGDGGKVIVWADETTDFSGTIKAKGGTDGGDGGFVETSGKVNLAVRSGASVDASASSGAAGQWLLDPSNVTITDGGTNSIPGGGGDVDSSSDSYSIDAASISAALNAGNDVTITTTNASGSEEGTITLTNATILKDTANNDVTLTLQADENIIVTNSTITSTADALNVILNADRDEDQSGAVSLADSIITTNGGSFVAGGGIDPSTTAAYGNAAYDDGVLLSNTDILTGAGDITLTGHGRDEAAASYQYGAYIYNGSALETSSGQITITGTGGDGDDCNKGLLLSNGFISTVDGDIFVTGTGAGSGTQNRGVHIVSSGRILSSGDGNVTVTGTSPETGTYAFGFHAQGGTVQAHDGNLSILGITRTGGGEGIRFHASSGQILSTGSGAITLEGHGDAGASGIVFTNTSPYDHLIGGPSAQGDITIIADQIGNMSGAHNLQIQTAGDLIFKPLTADTRINIGASASGFDLTTGDLSRLSVGGKLIIGDSAAGTGDVYIDGIDFSAADYDVEVYGGTTSVTGGGLALGEGDFLAYAQNGKDLSVDGAITRDEGADGLLDLRADENIVFTNGGDITALASALNVVLNADRNGDRSGAISLTGSTIATNGGYFVAGGGSGTVDGDLNGTLGDGGDGADVTATYGNAAYDDGVTLSNAGISTGAGDLILTGHGQNNSAEDYQYGIYLMSAASLASTGGRIVLDGTGGDGDDYNVGVWIKSANTLVSSVDGEISVTARGGSNGLVGGYGNYGFRMDSGADLKSLGTTAEAADIYITAYGGNGHMRSDGMRIRESGTSISSDAGDISLVGYGGSNGVAGSSGGYGITLEVDADIISSGTGAISLAGTGGNGDTANAGIHIIDTGTSVSGKSAVTITGHGQGFGGSGNNDITINDASVTAEGAGADITLTGDTLDLLNAPAVSAGGALTVKPRSAETTIGVSGGSGTLSLSDAYLGYLSPGTKLVVGDAAAGTGVVDIDSWDLSGAGYDVEVYGGSIDLNGLSGAENVSMLFEAGTGNVDILSLDLTMTGAADRAFILRAAESVIFNNSTLDASGVAGRLDVLFNADRDADQSGAVSMSGSTITTNGGYFVAGGGSGSVDSDNNGILGDGGDGADVTATYGNAAYDDGIWLNSADISTGAGDLILTGNGSTSLTGTGYRGIYLLNGSALESESGLIKLTGTAGNGTDSSDGVLITDSDITTETGGIAIHGRGGGQGFEGTWAHRAVGLGNGTVVSSTGTGANAADITITADEQGYTNIFRGFEIYSQASLTTIDGDILISVDNGAASSQFGIGSFYHGGEIISTGEGNITLESYGTADKDGIYFHGAGNKPSPSGGITSSCMVKAC